MEIIWMLLAGVLLFVFAVLVVYDAIFSTNKRHMCDERFLPSGEQYEPYHGVITQCVDMVLEIPYQPVTIDSYDGTKLCGRYYHQKDGAPILLFLHGYRCSALRDGNGILLYSRKLGFNVLLVDQRGHGKSAGRAITFGVKERLDCREWVRYLSNRFGMEQRIYLSGLSMGGATVLMASDLDLPGNVIGILADCPYSSPKAILCSVIKSMGFPVKITYFLAKLSARYLGDFDIEETSAIEAIQKSRLPILIIHGDDDRFVPYQMSKDCQKAGADRVKLVLIQGAGHGVSHCVDADAYEEAVYTFFANTGGLEKVETTKLMYQ